MRLPSLVLAFGLVSLLTDVSSEMIFPLLPVFLTQVLGATPIFVGLVDGVAEAVASFLKLWSGHLADRMEKRKPLILFGYGLAGFVRPLMAVAAAPWHVLAVRVTDRIGKGIRTSPRDALIADSVTQDNAGRAFGLQRAMDHFGAVLGPLAAAGLLAAAFGLRSIFALAAIPGILAFLVLLGIREPARHRKTEVAPDASGGSGKFPPSLRKYLAILFLFSLGNSSDLFLLLRAKDLGIATAALPLLWAAFHVMKSTSSYWAGKASDCLPRRAVIIAGWVVYAGVYLGFGLAQHPAEIWGLFALYGLYYGFTEPAEKALVYDLVPQNFRGRAYGSYNFVLGISSIPASVLTGWLWQTVSPAAALMTGAALAGAASFLLLLWRPAKS